MNARAISRRPLLRRANLASAGSALVAINPLPPIESSEAPEQTGPRSDGLNVRDFGTVEADKQNDLPAFVDALRAAAGSGGNVVRAPRGNYLIQFRASTARTGWVPSTAPRPGNHGGQTSRVPRLVEAASGEMDSRTDHFLGLEKNGNCTGGRVKTAIFLRN
jgi:hypothetical protein